MTSFASPNADEPLRRVREIILEAATALSRLDI
jgi:hypothetical protein